MLSLDLFSLYILQCHIHFFPALFLKLQLIDLSDGQPIGNLDMHACITASGWVALNEQCAPAFIMQISQNPWPGASPSCVALRGLLPIHPACCHLLQHVPQPGTLLTFTRVILAVDNSVPTININGFTNLPHRSSIPTNNMPVLESGSMEDID